MSLDQHPIVNIRIIDKHPDGRKMSPGDAVCHHEHVKSSYGLVVHVSDGKATVLWTKAPAAGLDYRSLTLPLMRRPEYARMAQQVFKIEHLADRAQAIYDKDE